MREKKQESRDENLSTKIKADLLKFAKSIHQLMYACKKQRKM